VSALLLVFGSMAIEGPAIGWAANHLKHHATADKPGDPHSPLDGFVHAHLGWLFTLDQADPVVYCRSLLKDPIIGRRTYATTDRSRNQWTVGLLGMGEGWHNNDHAFPRSAVHGLDRWQFDASAWLIQSLELVAARLNIARRTGSAPRPERVSADET
jgi:stearoyl-CoA desaturase (delta-9 desaturase)